MIQENFNVDPDDVPEINADLNNEELQDDDEGYDILPSNGPGLAGDDGEQVVDEAEIEEFDEDADDEEDDD